jgi:hypothetical protein
MTIQIKKVFRSSLAAIFAGLFLVSACAGTTDTYESTLVKGAITASSEDGDEGIISLEDIQFLIVITREGVNDTLMNASTDSDGFFSAVARVPERSNYPLVISRNERVLHVTSLMLAAGDTVTISGQVPGIDRNIRFESVENTAMATYERLQRNYGRVATLAYGGVLAQDTIPVLMNQWSDLFWSMREQYAGTFAAELSSIDAIDVLEGWNNDKVLQRLEELGDDEIFFEVKLVYGGHLLARRDGLDAGLDYLRRLERAANDQQQRNAIQMRRIQLLIDLEETDRARQEVRSIAANSRAEEDMRVWAAEVDYILSNLIEGQQIPEFSVQFDSGNVTFPAGDDAPYFLVEVVLLADPEYQAVYPELLRLQQSLPQNSIGFYTIPVDPRQLTIDAFFEERTKGWPFAVAGAVRDSGILDVLRIEEAPTRYLVSSQGIIINRYVGHGISQLQTDILTIIETLN